MSAARDEDLMREEIMIRPCHLKALAGVFVLILASGVTSSAQYFPPPDSAGYWIALKPE